MYLHFIPCGTLIASGIKNYLLLFIFRCLFHAKNAISVTDTQQINSALNYIEVQFQLDVLYGLFPS
jgi:hypothetical protein